MEYSGGMQEHASPLPYALAMEEEVQSSNYVLPQALAIPYCSNIDTFMSHEEGFNYITMHAEDIPKLGNYEPNIQVYAEPNTSCLTPSLPLWANVEPLISGPIAPFDHGYYLLNLQSVLESQYGISLTLDELLSFDALPALLQPENDHQQSRDIDIKLEQPLNHNNNYSSLQQVNQVADATQAACLQLTNQDASNVCVSPINNKMLRVNEAYKPQDISSPGSAASSSVITDSEICEKTMHTDQCIAQISNLALASNPWINRSISWARGGDDESSVLQALNAVEALEAVEPPAQRRKLQGITLEQVLQAEKLQQINAASTHVQPPCEYPLLITSGPVLGSDGPTRGGSSAARSDLYMVRERSHDLFRPLPSRPSTFKVAATSVEPQSIAARHRRKRIKEKTENLGKIIPGASRLDTAAMFDLAIKYVHFLQAQMVCLENEVSFSSQRCRSSDQEVESVNAFRRALIHRLLSSQDVQHLLSKEGLCLVTESLASRLNLDPKYMGPSEASQGPLHCTV